MAAEILECSEDDLIHFAATQKIEVHVLADKYISVRHYKDGSDKYIFLPSVALVSHEYFSSLEISNVHTLLMLIIPGTENNNELFNVFPPFLDGMGEEIELSDFVILHGELMKIKKPVEQNVLAPKDVSDREESTYLNIIGGLLGLMLGETPAGAKQSVYINQSAIVSALLVHYEDKAGISKRTLESKFAKANKSITQE